jgi:hypothetical protein
MSGKVKKLNQREIKGLNVAKPVLRIRDVYLGSEFLHPGSRGKKIPDPEYESKNSSIFSLFLSSRNNDLGCSSRIWIFFPSQIPDPGAKKHLIPDPQHCHKVTLKAIKGLHLFLDVSWVVLLKI